MAHRRSIFLINKRFQLRFCFYVCSWLFVLSLIYPFLIYSLFEYFIRYMSLDPLGPELSRLQNLKVQLLWLLGFMQLLFLSVTFLVSIFLSHRIAGPLFKLGRFLSDARSGNLDRELFFRKGDHFQELAAHYNEMAQGIRQMQAEVATKIEKAISVTPPAQRSELEEAVRALRRTTP